MELTRRHQIRHTLLLAALVAVAMWRNADATLATCQTPAGLDRTAIQAAIDAAGPGGCVDLGPGAYTVDTPIAAPGQRRPYAMLELRDVEMFGAGPLTEIHFTGDARLQDWWGITITRGHLHDLVLDGSALVGTGEQTHLVRVIGPSVGVELDHVAFDHPLRPKPDGSTWLGGDCVQLVGYAGTEVFAPYIHDNEFIACDRSGVAAHGGVIGMVITDNHFRATGDQDVDGEGTGDGSDGWVITRNTFVTPSWGQGTMAIQVQATTNVDITDNVFEGRGVYIYASSGVRIARNNILRTRLGTLAAVEIQKDSVGVTLEGNTIQRATSAGSGSTVRAVPHGTGTPARIAIKGGVLMQGTPGSVVEMQGIVGLEIDGVAIAYVGPAGAGHGVSATGSASIRTTDITVSNTAFAGALISCVVVSGSRAGTGSVALRRNVAIGPAQGLRCENAYAGALVQGPVTVQDLLMPTPVCGNPPLAVQL